MKTAFINATIYPVNTDIIYQGTLLIEKNTISYVGAPCDTDGFEIIDCSGLHITPGFVDAHAHTGVWGEWNTDYDGNEMSDPLTPYVRIMDSIHPEDVGFEDARSGGVTTLGITHGSANAIGGQLCVVKPLGSELEQMLIKHPAGLKMALGENPKRVGANNKRAPTTRMGVAYLIRKAFLDAQEYKKTWERYKEGKEEKEPKLDLGMEALVQVLDGKMPVRCHAHRADDIITAIRLAEEFGYELIIEHTTEGYKVANTLASKNIKCCVGPAFGDRAKRELRDITYKNPVILHKEGVFVSLITDSPFNPIHTLRDQAIWAIREGLPQEDALKLITLNPATVLGLEDRIGSLEVGKDADLVLLNGDPFDARSKPVKTYINGQLVYTED
ncbi:MAG: amidohydrolase [Candidatus Heimdallarchaeota archaeon]|nr:amidohydrolase [Candidatus Heimdallarchaeota archaeon]